jgi:hypothetical protein
MQYLWLLLLGLAVGAFGTLIGAGGGFILMPVLLLACPDKEPATLTAISLAVVFFNASSGSYSYTRMKRVDFKSGLWFLLTGVPGAVAGAYVVHYIPRQAFNLVFGALLLAGSGFIFLRTFGGGGPKHASRPAFTRTFVDAEGVRHVYGYNLALGMALSFAVGLASSLLGIGGGIIHVPAMVSILNFPVHIATATSHFILAAMAMAGTVVHIVEGALGWSDLPNVLPLAAGAVVGARAGAHMSTRIHGRWIMRSLAVALGLVGVRVLVPAIATMLSHR